MKSIKRKRRSSKRKGTIESRWTRCANSIKKQLKPYRPNKLKSRSILRLKRSAWLKIRRGLSSLRNRNWLSFRRLMPNKGRSLTKRQLRTKESCIASNMTVSGNSSSRKCKWTSLQKKLAKARVISIPWCKNSLQSKKANLDFANNRLSLENRTWRRDEEPLLRKSSSWNRDNVNLLASSKR